MKCPRCGAASNVIETRAAVHMTTARRRECLNGHRFTTHEVYGVTFKATDTRLKRVAETIKRRIELWKRDRVIAAELHKGYRSLMQRYGLTKSAVYLAARRAKLDRRNATKRERA